MERWQGRLGLVFDEGKNLNAFHDASRRFSHGRHYGIDIGMFQQEELHRRVQEFITTVWDFLITDAIYQCRMLALGVKPYRHPDDRNMRRFILEGYEDLARMYEDDLRHSTTERVSEQLD